MIRFNVCRIITICIILFLTGCTSMNSIDPRVTIIDDPFFSDLTITEVKITPHYGDFMEVQVTGRNDTSTYNKLEYKIEWLDNNEMLIPSVMSGWTKFPGFENSEFRFKAVAPTMSATDFRIKIRREN